VLYVKLLGGGAGHTSGILSVIPVHCAGVCVLQEAVSELQTEIEQLKYDNARMTATATQFAEFADIRAKPR